MALTFSIMPLTRLVCGVPISAKLHRFIDTTEIVNASRCHLANTPTFSQHSE